MQFGQGFEICSVDQTREQMDVGNKLIRWIKINTVGSLQEEKALSRNISTLKR
jgi:hypothetical protein